MQTGILSGILFGQAEAAAKQDVTGLSTWVVMSILVGIAVLALIASNVVKKTFRMPEHG